MKAKTKLKQEETDLDRAQAIKKDLSSSGYEIHHRNEPVLVDPRQFHHQLRNQSETTKAEEAKPKPPARAS